MSAPNANNTAPAANPSTSSSVPKWGEPGFVAVDGARYGEDGFVPCDKPHHRGPREGRTHTAEECIFGGRPHDPNRARQARQPARGRGRQNNFHGSGQQHPFPGSGRPNNFSGSQQNSFPGLLGQQNSLAGLLGQQNSLLGLGLQNNFPGFGLQSSQVPESASQDPRRDSVAALAAIASNISDIIQGRDQQQLLQLQLQLQQQQQQLALQSAALQQQLDAQQSQQQPSSARSRRGRPQDSSTDAQRNGVKKNQKRGARKYWQPITRKDDNNGPGGNGSAGAGGSAKV
jgi:hypothetical protein